MKRPPGSPACPEGDAQGPPFTLRPVADSQL
jgi:hypothetical protein